MNKDVSAEAGEGSAFDDSLRLELARGDLSLASARPVLRHLLSGSDSGLFNDEIVARMRAMLRHLAGQMLASMALAGGTEPTPQRTEEYLGHLLLEDGLVAHVHALSLETQVAARIAARSGVDQVLSPLLQDLAASPDEERAAAAMQVMAAQARFVRQAARMALPPGELPPDLLHRCIQLLEEVADDFDVAEAAARTLRESYEERHTRRGRLAHLVDTLGEDETEALAIDHAGLGIFATALALASGTDRDLTVLSLAENQYARLVLSLRAAGLDRADLERQFFLLHPDISVPGEIAQLPLPRARMLLAGDAQ